MSKRLPLMRSGLRMLALGASLLPLQPLIAQEQENPSTPGQIPDPGTYQGSVTLQQQSDQQDQQFRQQQEQQSQQYSPQYQGTPRFSGNNGANYGGGSVTPAFRCNVALQRSPSLASLRGLVELGASTRDPRYFNISRRATSAERPVLMKWLAGRRHCQTMANGFSAMVQQVNLKATQITDKMILALVQGRMTFGEFNYVRAQNTGVFLDFLHSH